MARGGLGRHEVDSDGTRIKLGYVNTIFVLRRGGNKSWVKGGKENKSGGRGAQNLYWRFFWVRHDSSTVV